MEETKLERSIRLAQKHINEIEKLGYTVAVGHNELNVYDFSKATDKEMDNPHFNPGKYIIAEIK